MYQFFSLEEQENFKESKNTKPNFSLDSFKSLAEGQIVEMGG